MATADPRTLWLSGADAEDLADKLARIDAAELDTGWADDATSGAIGKVLSDEEVRKNWHSHMSWSMAESGLPTCDPQSGKIDAGKVKLR